MKEIRDTVSLRLQKEGILSVFLRNTSITKVAIYNKAVTTAPGINIDFHFAPAIE